MAFEFKGPFISSDGHLEVLPERWRDRVPKKYRDDAPRTITLPDGGDALFIEGVPPHKSTAADLRSGLKPGEWQPFGLKVMNIAGTGPPEQRLDEQDQEGMAAEILFPNMQAGPVFWRNIKDDDAYKATVRAYNDWLGEEYCSVDRERLIGLGVIPWTNCEDAIAEMEHCAKLGLRGVLLGIYPGGYRYPSELDDPFWEAAVSMKMPLTVHVGLNSDVFRGGGGARKEQPEFWYPNRDPEMLKNAGRAVVGWASIHGNSPATSLAPLILSGTFDRHPDLKIFFAETRLGWVPFWMENADVQYERHGPYSERLLGFEPVKRGNVSDYVREHIYFSVQNERVAIELRAHMGVEHVMYATDFPHFECEWPNSRKFIEQIYYDVPEDERLKMLGGNVIEYFGLHDTAYASAFAPGGVAAG